MSVILFGFRYMFFPKCSFWSMDNCCLLFCNKNLNCLLSMFHRSIVCDCSVPDYFSNWYYMLPLANKLLNIIGRRNICWSEVEDSWDIAEEDVPDRDRAVDEGRASNGLTSNDV